jgi:hypothetical protein
MVNEDDDIINKIKEAFGIKSDSLKSNNSESETRPSQFYKGVDEIRELPIEPREQREQRAPRVRRPLRRDQQLMEELNDITKEDVEELTFQTIILILSLPLKIKFQEVNINSTKKILVFFKKNNIPIQWLSQHPKK